MAKIYWNKYLSVFLITFLTFLVIFLLVQKISYQTSADIIKIQKDMNNYLLALNLQSEIAKEYICSVDVFEITKEKAEIGIQLDSLEKNLGSENEIVKDIKSQYTLLSIRQWLLVKRFKQECNPSLNIILFFYSNKVEKDKSEAQGYVLDYIYKKYTDKVVIYALDADQNNPALNTLKDIYKVEKAPTVIINERKYENVLSASDIERILKLN